MPIGPLPFDGSPWFCDTCEAWYFLSHDHHTDSIVADLDKPGACVQCCRKCGIHVDGYDVEGYYQDDGQWCSPCVRAASDPRETFNAIAEVFGIERARAAFPNLEEVTSP